MLLNSCARASLFRKGELVPCMDATNEISMTQVGKQDPRVVVATESVCAVEYSVEIQPRGVAYSRFSKVATLLLP